MANRGLGTLTLDLVTKISGFTGPLDQAGRKLSDLEKRAYAVGKGIGTALRTIAGVAAGAAVATVTALTAVTVAAINQADAIRDLSIRTGVSTEALSVFSYAASQTGTDIDGLGRGLKVLAKNAADSLNPTSEQSKVFKALGINAADSSGKLKNLADLTREIAEKFKTLEDGTTKAALAQALFGKAGLELTEFLNQGSEGLDAFTRKAEELGIIISQDTANAADEFNDTLGDLKAIIGGVGLQIASGLLPALNEGASSLKEMAKEGDLAANVVTVLSAVFRAGVGALEAYNTAVQVTSAAIETIVNASDGFAEIQKNIGVGGLFDEGSMAAGAERVRDAFREGDKALERIHSKSKSIFANVQSSSRGPQSQGDSGLERRLGIALSNQSAAKKSGKTGKSDEEKEAERLQKAYESLMESMQERIALFNTEGEAAKVAYDTQHGALQELTQAQKEQVIALASEYDQMVKLREEGTQRAKIAAEETDRIRDGLKAGKELLEDVEFELELMKLTNAERATAIQLRGLEAEAVAEYGEAIAEANRKIEESLKQVELMDGFRDSFATFFEDVIGGTKSVKDAFTDMLDDINRMILKRISENWVEQLFGAFGTNQSGSAGGGWMQAFAGLFGGGRASGGPVSTNKFYEVGEQDRPELLMARGKQYLIPGNQGKVVPIGSGGREVNVTQIFNNPVMSDRSSEAQRAEQAGRKIRLAARNS